MSIKPEFVDWFRNSAPYINAHRSETFVVQFGGEAVLSVSFPNLVHDLALLHSLGVKLILVHGARPQIEEGVSAEGLCVRYEHGLRVTDEASMRAVMKAAGQVRLQIESMLSMGLANSPMAGARIRVTSGNFVIARPIGVRDGVDYHHTGEVRRVDVESIRKHLEWEEVVVISPIGFSPTGEMFSLVAADVATAIAVELRAAKLICLSETGSLPDPEGEIIRQLTLEQAKNVLVEQRHRLSDDDGTVRSLHNAVHACRNGVRRAHIIDRHIDGALIAELFTRDGVGTMVSADLYEDTRRATIDDVGGLIELIQPLEEDGTLVRRSREKLEAEIDHFLVMERDGAIIGCAALYPIGDETDMELACVAVHREYRNAGRGDALMQRIEQEARSRGAGRLFVLTTRTTHWFREYGFEPGEVDQLPLPRKSLYNYQRNSKVLIKALD